MNTVKTLSLSAALLMAGGTLSLAHAGGVVSDITTQSADINFAATGTVFVVMKVNTGLTAGSYPSGKDIAAGVVAITGGSMRDGLVGIRWTPGTGTVSQADGLSSVIKIPGDGRSDENFITVKLWTNTTLRNPVDGGSGWIVGTGMAPPGGVTYIIQFAQNQVVSPDTYTLSVDGVVWGS